MAIDRGDVKFTLAADDSQLVATLNGIKAHATSASASFQGAFAPLQNALLGIKNSFGGLQTAFLGLAAVVAGGGAFKAIIGASAEWNGENAKIAKQLGVTTQQASVLSVALNHLGIDSDTYTTAALKMSKQIFSNEDAFKKLGVTVEDTVMGVYRPITDRPITEVMTEVLEVSHAKV